MAYYVRLMQPAFIPFLVYILYAFLFKTSTRSTLQREPQISLTLSWARTWRENSGELKGPCHWFARTDQAHLKYPQISFSSPISFITVNTATCPRHLATDTWASKLSTSFPGSFISPPQRGAFGVGRWKALETRLENLRLNIHPRGSVCSRNGSRKILSCKKIPIWTFSTPNKHYISGVPCISPSFTGGGGGHAKQPGWLCKEIKKKECQGLLYNITKIG